ncbi:protein phosphatase methylesterase, eukaryotic [Kipferlia bialata]|uniref:protein phosphatase methylesterase-1 n=1 Tax=Kipferlia bialata TaxID=797122 RepID=A0A9K3D367_9EUKA|nr:protein phosphatase methylesterase, eukaryotic [Kipferlia bialata]|eukprot:g8686.t1
MIHGAGGCALSFGPLAAIMRHEVRCLSYDLRGHGGSVIEGQTGTPSMSLDELVSDAEALLTHLYPYKGEDATGVGITLIGHSLGGSIAAHMAGRFSATSTTRGWSVKACILVDITEQEAVNALPAMASIAKREPKAFMSMAKAVQWAHRLDDDVTMAHMAGKIQIAVIPGSGHYIMLDATERMASEVIGFMRRNHLTASLHNVPFDFAHPTEGERAPGFDVIHGRVPAEFSK